MSLTTGTRLGPYEITSPIGAGGMGEVYRALDTRLQREVAIKVLPLAYSADVDRLRRFEQEARAAAALNHPNILAVHDVGTHDGAPYLVSELLDGQTLRDRLNPSSAAARESALAPQGLLPLRKTIDYAVQVAKGLAAAHEKGIVHRDLKPENLFVTADGRVKILDFGLAKLTEREPVASESSPTAAPATVPGLVLGTVGYMSPEQVRGQPVDHRSDVFAFGAILYEILGGRRAFEGSTAADTLTAILREDPPDLPATARQIPPALVRIVDRCLEKSPGARFQSAGDLAFALDALSSQVGVAEALSSQSGATEAVPGKARGFAARVPWAVAAAMALVAGVTAWVAWRTTQAQDRALVRLEVDLGADVRLPPVPQDDVVISPDGTRLAYVSLAGDISPLLGARAGRSGTGALIIGGRGSGTTTRLFMRRLDQPAAIELPGTEGAQRPFFSPDSQWIGFIARNSLYKVAVDGGAAVPLADVQVREAVWGEDDSILAMAGGIPTALWRIPASGGEPAKVLDPPEELLGHRLLQILPGGGHALVAGGMAATALGRFDREATIEALSLSDGSRTTVVRGATAAHYLPTGHLVYVSEGVLFAVAFDPYTLETRGAAVPILDDVQFNASSGATSLSFSREGTIVYRKGAGVAFSTFAAPRARIDWIDTAGRRSPLSARAGRFERLRFSPDGTRLAVLINDENGRDEWVLDLRRDNFSKITFGNLAITTPAWTRDGRYVIFGSGPPAPGIYWARADGDGEPQILVKTQGLNFVWSYSQDAGRLAYFALLGRGGGIFTVPIAEENGGLKAGTPAPFFESSSRVSTPEFSPDGRWIAYTTDETGRNEVQVRPFPAASGQGGKVSISTDGGENPRWSRTGNELLYQSGNRILSVRYTVTGDTFVPDRPRVRVDTLESADAWGWDLAPDGRIAVLTAVPVESEQALQLPPLEHTVMFLLNFFDELRRRVPVE